jgi:hypothetical protein
MRRVLLCVGILLFVSTLVNAGPPPIVDQNEIDSAINKGTDWLLERYKDGFDWKDTGEDGMAAELVVYTLIHAGVAEDHPVMQKGVELLLHKELGLTYKVGVTAMALRKLDPVRYKERIGECALWLCENQCKNGQWGYGQPVDKPGGVPTGGGGGGVVASGEEDEDARSSPGNSGMLARATTPTPSMRSWGCGRLKMRDSKSRNRSGAGRSNIF